VRENASRLTFRVSPRFSLECNACLGQNQNHRSFQASDDPAEQNKIMHSMLITDNGLVLMASDTPNRMDYTPGTNFSISLSGEDDAELRGYWEKLSAGGTITMPLNQAPWGDTFGMCVDKFGISWLVNINAPQAS
jgi:PhnB protein